MAMRIELSELQRLTSRSREIEGTLNTELNKISSILEDICNNVQSSELTNANQNLKQAITNAINTINKYLPNINRFMEDQVNQYIKANESAKSEIDSLISSINSTFQAK